MQITNEMSLPVPPAEAWPVLLDLEKIAPCLPGASITGVDGNSYEGKAKVKVGPITVEYRGVAEFVERDEDARRAVISATGKDTRGQGRASATITANLAPEGSGSKVIVETDLDITGKVAQFGSGVIKDTATAILGTFAERLGTLMTDQQAQTQESNEESERSAVPAVSTSAPHTDEPLNLLQVAKTARATRADADRGRRDGPLYPSGAAPAVSVVAACLAAFAAGLAIGRVRC